MHLTLVGLSHKTAPVDIREKLTFPAEVQREALSLLTSNPSVSEAVIVSTCNRTEIYAVTTASGDGFAHIIDFLVEYHQLDRQDLLRYLYTLEGEAVVRHLFRVVSSLDSMVVGEAQILGQIKQAYELGFEHNGTGRVFNKLFRHSFEVGKRVRNETAIGEAAVSISYAAVELAKKVFDSLQGRTVLLLGAGKMSELTAKHLVGNGVAKVFVTNRTYERACELAERCKGEPVVYDRLFERMLDADIVISSTAATSYVVTEADVAKVMRGRRARPLFFIDIAVPRDIDPEVNNIDDVFLYDIDSLNGVVQSNLAERMREADLAEQIIAEEIAAFERWLESLEVVPTVAAIRAKAEGIRRAEMEKAFKRLDGLSAQELETVEALTASIVNKMLHGPTNRLKAVAGQRFGVAYIEAARYLWGLDSNPDGKNPHLGLGLLRNLFGRKEKAAEPAVEKPRSAGNGDTIGCQ